MRLRLAAAALSASMIDPQAPVSFACETLGRHANAVCEVAFSPDGTQLASGAGDGTVRLWPLEPTK